MFIKFEKKKNSKTNLTDPPDQANKRFLELNPHIIKVRTSYVNKTYDKGRVYELGDEKLKMTVKGKEEERGGSVGMKKHSRKTLSRLTSSTPSIRFLSGRGPKSGMNYEALR